MRRKIPEQNRMLYEVRTACTNIRKGCTKIRASVRSYVVYVSPGSWFLNLAMADRSWKNSYILEATASAVHGSLNRVKILKIDLE